MGFSSVWVGGDDVTLMGFSSVWVGGDDAGGAGWPGTLKCAQSAGLMSGYWISVGSPLEGFLRCVELLGHSFK